MIHYKSVPSYLKNTRANVHEAKTIVSYSWLMQDNKNPDRERLVIRDGEVLTNSLRNK